MYMYILNVEDICQYFSETLPTHLTVSFIKRYVTKKNDNTCICNYCKALNICGIKFSRFNENDVRAHFNFGVYNLLWLYVVKKI